MHRIAIAAALAIALSACAPPDPPAGHDRFTIESRTLRIHVEGNEAAMERNAAQIMSRIDLIDPDLIRPGIGLWVDDNGSAPEPFGEPHYELVGRVVSVERIDQPMPTQEIPL